MKPSIIFLVLQLMGITPGLAVVLYDASLGTVPGAQAWVAFDESGVSITHTGAATRFNTLDSFGLRAGVSSELTAGGIFQHPLMPVLDRSDGFEVEFSLQVLTEAHNLNRDDNGDGLLDRAGFSVIALSQDLEGIEVAFFDDKIWVYEDAQTNAANRFTQAENVLFDTTVFTHYKIVGSVSGYALFANGVNILSGVWRNYTPSGVSPFTDPYDNPSFLFFGDNTQSASSEVLLGNISVAIGPFQNPAVLPRTVPIPAPALALLFFSIVFGGVKKLPRKTT